MAPNPKVVQAFRSMRDKGITKDKVKPVLKKLLKLYEKNWALIESENYRVLADAIFEGEDSKVSEPNIGKTCDVFLTPDGKGWGLRTLEKLPKGAFVCEFVGEILTISELYTRNREKHTCPVLLDAYWGLKGVPKDEEALCLDATCYGNVARFINHR